METWLEREEIYRGRMVSLSTGYVELDDGTTAWREVVHHPGGVAVVPMLEDSVLLVQKFIEMKNEWKKEEKKVGREYREFHIAGRELEKAKEVLSLHGIEFEERRDEIIVKMPQRRSRMAILLLDREHWYNEELRKRRKGPHTLDKFFDVEIKAVR